MIKNLSNKKYNKKYPKASKARSVVSNAIRIKKFTRKDSCEECASTLKVEAHHEDYSRPLDIKWLCEVCHKSWHQSNTPLNRI